MLALICTSIVSVAQILLKIGSTNFSLSNVIAQIYNIPLIIGGGLYVIGAFLFILAFRHGELSVVYPVMAFGYVLVSLLSFFFLDEIIGSKGIVGVIFITLGVIFIGRGGQQ